MENQPSAFMSYTHVDDSDNRLTEFCKLLSYEVNRIIGKEFPIFQDNTDILWGENWRTRINESLNSVTFLIPIITPSYFNSEACRNELEKFLKREKDLGRTDLILPMYYIETPVFENGTDKLADVIYERQYFDWRKFRTKNFDTEEVREKFAELARQIKIALERKTTPYHRKRTTTLVTPNEENDELGTEKIIEIRQVDNFECDIPPANVKWVGREKELLNLDSPIFKVIFITGIGGQGKSGLASHFIKNVIEKSNEWDYWDWRDFKEEGNRLHSKLISIIERISVGKIRGSQLKEESIENIIELFFRELGSKRVIFVFDNIDKYIDLEEFLPIGGMRLLIRQILHREHNSKFIFTCRPFIRNAEVGFYQLQLSGLSISDTEKLLKSYNIPFKDSEITSLTKNVYELTSGHPLWINFIAAQAKRGSENLNNFIRGIRTKSNFDEKDFSAILSQNILLTVWNTLNENQKILLRGMSETIRAEREENLRRIMRAYLKHNRFTKALNTLKALNLVVVKSSPSEPDLLELHPLVKEFIRSKFGRIEQSRFITLYVEFYNDLICLLKPKLSWQSPLSVFQNWTNKIELEINKGDFKSALSSLLDINESILTAGYVEEFIRVSEPLFSTIDWIRAITEEYNYFHIILKSYIECLIDLGRYEEAEGLLLKYQKCLPDKGTDYVSFCHTYSSLYFSKEEYEESIKWAEQGEVLVRESGVETSVDIKHRKALALRETRKPKNIEKALEIFLGGEKLNNLLKGKQKDSADHGSAFWGNIGRCMWYMQRNSEALLFYRKSLTILNQEATSLTITNKGYAAYWIAQTLLQQNQKETATYFYKKALIHWNAISPPKASKVEIELKGLLSKNKGLEQIIKLDDWEIEKYCNDWLKND